MNEIDSFLAELGIVPESTDRFSVTPINTNINSELSTEEVGNVDCTISTDTNTTSLDASNIVEDIEEYVSSEETNVPTTEETPEAEESEPKLIAVPIYNNDSDRFSGAEWFDAMQNSGVSVIGLGGIGSWLSLLLSRLKVRCLYLRDMDIVEPVNFAGQLYDVYHMGNKKIDAIRDIICKFNNSRPSMYYDSVEFTIDSIIPTVSSTAPTWNVMLGLDSITARKTVYYYWKSLVGTMPKEYIFIDGRLTADRWQIFAIPSFDKKRMKVYEEEWLFPQSEAEHLPCSFKQTSYMASMIASYMCNLYVNFIAESTKPIVPYNIPFMTEFNAQTLEMKTYECD